MYKLSRDVKNVSLPL